MKNMKKLLGIILSLSLVLGMIMPSIKTMAEGTEQMDISLVKSFRVFPTKDLVEGYTIPAYGPEGQGSYDYYEPSQTQPQIEVTFQDDSVKVYTNDELMKTFGMGCGFSTNQTATNVWGTGLHTATAHFANMTYEMELEVVENPVKSVEGIYHGIIVEGTQVGYDAGDVEFIFTFSDGSKESYSYYDYVAGGQLAPILTPIELKDGIWDAGEHYFEGKTHGREFQVKVNVLSLEETPIKSMTVVATRDLVAEWHAAGMPGNEFLDVHACIPKIEITYRDDTKETVYFDSLRNKYDGVIPNLFMKNTSLEGTGERTAELEFYGHKVPFTVNVVENPIESISAITTKPLVEGWRGFYSLVLDGGMILTVNYKDGTKISGTSDELLNIFYDYPDDHAENAVIGKNVAEVEYLGKVFDVEFELVEDPNPVVDLDVEVKDGEVLYEKASSNNEIWYEYGHLLDVTLTFKDGSKITGNMDEVNRQLESIAIKEVMSFDDQDLTTWGIGKHSAQIYYGFGEFPVDIEVEIVENPYSKATISNENGLSIVLEKSSGVNETYVAKRFSPVGSMGYNSNMFGYLETDKGTLPVEINFGGGRRADYTNVSSMYIHGVQSNELKNCKWLEQQMIVEMYGNVPATAVNNSAEELRNMVLTEADYAMGRDDNVSAKLVISENETVSNEDRTLLDRATESLDNYKEGLIVDLTMYKEYPGMMSEVTEKVPEPNGKVSITMAVPEEILASGTNPELIKMVRIHDGETTVLPCTYDTEAKTITFETDAFSTYSMVYEVGDSNAGNSVGTGTGNTGNAGSTGTGTDSNSSSSNKAPNTGDTNLGMGYSIMFIIALAVIVFIKRKSSFVKLEKCCRLRGGIK